MDDYLLSCKAYIYRHMNYLSACGSLSFMSLFIDLFISLFLSQYRYISLYLSHSSSFHLSLFLSLSIDHYLSIFLCLYFPYLSNTLFFFIRLFLNHFFHLYNSLQNVMIVVTTLVLFFTTYIG